MEAGQRAKPLCPPPLRARTWMGAAARLCLRGALAAGAGVGDANLGHDVALLDLIDDVHALCHGAEVGVIAVERGGVALDDEPLAIAVEAAIRAAGHADGAAHEREPIVLGGHLVAARAGARGVAALDDPGFDAMEGEAIEEAVVGILLEMGHGGAHRGVVAQADDDLAARGVDSHGFHCWGILLLGRAAGYCRPSVAVMIESA